MAMSSISSETAGDIPLLKDADHSKPDAQGSSPFVDDSTDPHGSGGGGADGGGQNASSASPDKPLARNAGDTASDSNDAGKAPPLIGVPLNGDGGLMDMESRRSNTKRDT